MNNNYDLIKGIISKIPIFGAMTEEEISFLLPFFSAAFFKQGEVIIKEGGSPTNLYLIISGEISVKKNEIELVKLGIGDSFGEVELIGIIPNLADCIAVTDCEILILPKKSLYTIKKSNQEFFIKLILNIARECCRRLAKADNFIIHNIAYEQNMEYY